MKPLVDSFFHWCSESLNRVPPSSETAKGIQYCLNQEKYLRVFLSDPQIPLDNNLAEQAIRPFCVGKKNWKLIDTVHGAQASAILYSIVETAKANELNIYQSMVKGASGNLQKEKIINKRKHAGRRPIGIKYFEARMVYRLP